MASINPWVILVLAGILEVGWAIGLKYTDGFSKFWPSLGTAALMGASFYLLSKSLQSLPIGTAYAVWTGIGAVGTAIFGMVLLGDPATAGRVVGILLIVAGIVCLKIVSA